MHPATNPVGHAADLKEGDLLYDGPRLVYTVVSVTKNPAVAEVTATVRFATDGGMATRAWNEQDTVPHVRNADPIGQGEVSVKVDGTRVTREI